MSDRPPASAARSASIVGRNGLEKILEIPLGEEEGAALRRSAGQLREVIQGLKL